MVFLVTYGLSGWYSWYNYEQDLVSYPNLIRDDIVYAVSACLILVSYFFALFGYRVSNLIKGNRTTFSLNGLELASNISFFLMLLFIAAYVTQYGGVSNALNAAAAIRSGYGELETGGKLTFTKYLMPIGVFPFLHYGYLFFIDKKNKYLVPFIVTTILLFLAFLLMSGRTRIVMYLIALILLILISSKRKISISKILKAAPLAILGAFFVIYGKKIFSSMEAIRNGESISSIINDSDQTHSFFESSVGYFTHRVYSVEAALSFLANSGDFIFFRDSFYLPLYFIPERLTGISKPDSISFFNTQVLTGIYDSMAPPGILAYGLYSLWIPGMFLIAFLYGAGFGYIDRLWVINSQKKEILIILLPAILVWSLYGSTGDTRIVVNGLIYIIIYVLILFTLNLKRIFK
ncbi:hypothetical protein ACTXLJ_07625 [Psychrobacter celer]|uniref:hypothetical protein n=1 Tax=Psychrobacter celer TaxID=306572 RepID=UPI003FCF8543